MGSGAPLSGRARAYRIGVLVVGAAWLGWGAFVGVGERVEKYGEDIDAVTRVVEVEPRQRFAEYAGVSMPQLEAIEDFMTEDGMLVLYTPLPGRDVEVLLRKHWEYLRNGLYPRPERVEFAQGIKAARPFVSDPAFDRSMWLDFPHGAATAPPLRAPLVPVPPPDVLLLSKPR